MGRGIGGREGGREGMGEVERRGEGGDFVQRESVWWVKGDGMGGWVGG